MFARGNRWLWLGILLSGCWASVQAQVEVDYEPSEISHFSFSTEPITPLPIQLTLDPDKRELGLRLFFDRRLADDGQTSCADCHALPPIGVSEQAETVQSSAQIDKQKRDIPLLYNVEHNFWYNWDGRFSSLETLLDAAVSDVDKFNSSWDILLAKIADDYQAAAMQAYATPLTQSAVIDALKVFLSSLNAPNAAFDRFLRGDQSALSERQQQGYLLFKRIGCSSCHHGRMMGGNLFEQFYIYRHEGSAESEPRLKDLGRYYITGEEPDRNSFRVPSLRNVALSAPYFHDGSAETLEDAVEEMAEHQLGVIPTAEQVALLVEFLQSLTGVHSGIEAPEASR